MNAPRAAGELPRLLAGARAQQPMTRAEHEAVHGPAVRPGDLPGACDAAGLRGRGGALFPTAVKLRAMAGARRRPVVVVNGAEGEPMSVKDRRLLELVPHLVLDGAACAAASVGAGEVLVTVPTTAVSARAALAATLGERDDASLFAVRPVPDAFLVGEETALLQALAGRPARPTLTPPYPAERGLGGRPTLVQNVETLAHLALVARHGAGWFRALGAPDHPGSTLLTVGGPLRGAGVFEVATGTALADVIGAAGGADVPLRAVLLGGYHGTWLDARDIAGVRLHRAGLLELGLALGAGVVVALPETACPVAEVTRVVGWLAFQAAGQYGPCVHGLAAIAGELTAVRSGRADGRSLRRLERWAGMVTGRGACHHPDGTTRFLATALQVFAGELSDHARSGPCPACRRPPVLRIPVTAEARAA